jgi:hypothetical protein
MSAENQIDLIQGFAVMPTHKKWILLFVKILLTTVSVFCNLLRVYALSFFHKDKYN